MSQIQKSILALIFAAGLAVSQTGTAPVGQSQTGAGSGNAGNATAPASNPGYGQEVPNHALSGNTPSTNSTLQTGGDGKMSMGMGWLGLLGLAGLFGIRRGRD